MKILMIAALALEAVGGLAFLSFAFVTLGFYGEAYRGPVPAVQSVFVIAALAAAFLPLLATVAVGWRMFLSSRPAVGPAVLALPLAVMAVAGPGAFLLLRQSEKSGAAVRDAERRREIAALRARALNGEASYCELVNADPDSTDAEMERCRTAVDATADDAAKARELAYFIDGAGGLRGWNPAQLGLAKEWDFNRTLPTVKPAAQPWFLKTFFAHWAKDPAPFATPTKRSDFYTLIVSVAYMDWTADARREFERSAAGPIAERMAKVKDWSTETTDDLRPAIENQLQRQRARIGEKR